MCCLRLLICSFVAALLVYDVTDAQSFTKVKNWVKELRQVVGPDMILAIAGNKSDMEKNRQVDPAEATAYVLFCRSVCADRFGVVMPSLLAESTSSRLRN